MSQSLPIVVILGRPNVGKSRLFNRLTGTRRSIVTDEPGITRDRIHGTANWQGRAFEVVDTGGLVPDETAAMPREVMRQAKVAIDSASCLVLVVDARTGLLPLDAELARLARTTGKPLVIAVNKVDTLTQEPLTAPFFALADDVFGVSAEHGTGLDALLDFVTRDFSDVPLPRRRKTFKSRSSAVPTSANRRCSISLPAPTVRLFRPSPAPRVTPLTR
jgi:GTP-binding protein